MTYHQVLVQVLNTPGAGRFLTQREFNNLLRREWLEAVAVLYFPRSVQA